MPTKSRPENDFVRLFISAYENDAWKNAALKFPDETEDGGIDGFAERSDKATLAIEHTVVEPFVGDITDQSEFIPEFTQIEKDHSLRVPGIWIQVFIPIGTLHLQKRPARDAILQAIGDWLRQNRLSLPKGQSKHVCKVGGPSGREDLEIVLTVKVVDLPGEGSIHIRRQEVGDTLSRVIEKMLAKKLPKLVAAVATKRVLLLERRHMNLLPTRILEEVEKCRPVFPSLAEVHEIWILENISMFNDNSYLRFERYEDGEVIAAFDFDHGKLFTRSENGITVMGTATSESTMSKLKTHPTSGKSKAKRNPDPYYPAAVQNVKEAARRLQEAGIVDAEGRRIRKDLPPDMREGQDRDFGG